MIRNGTFLTAALMFSTTAFAQGAPSGCSDYPYTNGMNVEMLDAGPKIIATASVGVSFDDVDAVNDARDEATLAAKAMIARFFAESVTSDEGIKKAVQETKSMQGDSKQASRTEAVDRIKVLTNSSKALLRGVLPLGDCYTPGKEMRVSVGLKPETIAAAFWISCGTPAPITRWTGNTVGLLHVERPDNARFITAFVGDTTQ